MFWTLFLAHLIADYPLQTNWMAAAKRTWNGLILHVLEHLAVMLILTWGSWPQVLPALLILTGAHYAIDTLKNIVNHYRPRWMIAPYFIDQVLHLASLILTAHYLGAAVPGLALALAGPWQIYTAGLLLATHVWFITERILYFKELEYVREVNRRYWPRLLRRGALVAGLLIAWSTAAVQFASTTATPELLPRRASTAFRRRAFLLDLLVTAGGTAFILIAIQF